MKPQRVVFVAGLLAAALVVGTRTTPVRAQAPIAAAEWKPAVEEYTIEQGDTLWDISKKVVGSPWLWPRVWAMNPEIQNPHWIYPGDQVRFYEPNGALPSMYDLVAASREMPQEVQPAPEPQQHKRVDSVDTAPKARRAAVDMRRFVGLFVTPQELAEAGTLTNAAEDKMLLSRADRVFVTFPKEAQPRSGERYLVYRTLGRVTHPVTKEPYGYMTQVTGIASIEGVEPKVCTARLDDTMVEVERGQFVSRLEGELKVELKAVPAASAVEGVVLAVQIDGGVVAGENNIVFIDKGKTDGVQRGNRFRVYRGGDPYLRGTGEGDHLPPQPIATLLVMDAKDTAATCLVTESRAEVEAGYAVRAVTN